jgi:hypothetical protein
VSIFVNTTIFANNKNINIITSQKEKESIVSDSGFIMPSAGALANSLKMIFGDIKWGEFIDIKGSKRVYRSNEIRALNLGREGADLFFLAIAEDADNLTTLSSSTNLLLNKIVINGKSLNSNSRKRKLKKLKNLIKEGKWDIVLKEISALKDGINSDFYREKREDLALLNNIGGWLEGYRLTLEAMNRDYKKGETVILLQKPLIYYLLKEIKNSIKLKTFSKRAEIIERLEKINGVLSNSKNFTLSKKQIIELSNILKNEK